MARWSRAVAVGVVVVKEVGVRVAVAVATVMMRWNREFRSPCSLCRASSYCTLSRDHHRRNHRLRNSCSPPCKDHQRPLRRAGSDHVGCAYVGCGNVGRCGNVGCGNVGCGNVGCGNVVYVSETHRDFGGYGCRESRRRLARSPHREFRSPCSLCRASMHSTLSRDHHRRIHRLRNSCSPPCSH